VLDAQPFWLALLVLQLLNETESADCGASSAIHADTMQIGECFNSFDLQYKSITTSDEQD